MKLRVRSSWIIVLSMMMPPMVASPANAVSADWYAEAAWQFANVDPFPPGVWTFSITIAPDPVLVNRATVALAPGPGLPACRGSIAVAVTGVSTPAGILPPGAAQFVVTPTLDAATLNGPLTIPCHVGDPRFPVAFIFIEQIRWTEAGSLEQSVTESFIGLHREMIAGALVRTNLATGDLLTGDDLTANASLEFGVGAPTTAPVPVPVQMGL